MNRLPHIAVMISLFSLSGCQSMNDPAGVGTAVGAVAGGIAGAQFGHNGGQVAGAAIGAAAGAVVGNAIGRASQTSDYHVSRGAFVKASQAPCGDTAYWYNGRTGNWGYYCPLRDGHTRIYGDYCREFMTTVYINGKQQRMYGTACRRPNGTWYDM